jgi:serine protease Do
VSGRRRLALIGAAALALGCGKAPPPTPAATASGSVPPPPSEAPRPKTIPVGADCMPYSFAPLARKADPAVATVKARVEKELPSGRRKVMAEGLGTAFVYDPAGLLLTNNHVIAKASEVQVGFPDGREFEAKVVGRDKHTDVAVLRIEERGLPALPLGDSDVIEVGDWVVAIGNPFGLQHTVSAGILSAKGRTKDDVKGLDETGYFNFLQTDASINPGNSGGPLLDLKGEVVGINAAVRANANSIGFAIPINMVKQLLPALIRDGKIRRSAIGVTVDALNSVEATRLGRPDRKGAWVKTVIPGGAADKSGIAPDDVIVGFEGKAIGNPNELRWLASIAGVDKATTVRVARGARVFDIKVTLGELPQTNDDQDEP